MEDSVMKTEQEQDTEETRVIFRKWKDGQIIALFPEIKETGYKCSSYMHLGQHGSADYYGVVHETTLATLDEYADLKKELESAPYFYKLKIRRRK
jgi:hypothetical protein